jgi:hypothetical protein
MRRGEAIDQRSIADAEYREQLLAAGILPPSLLRCSTPLRPGKIRSAGDYICARHPIKPGRVDPQSGGQSQQLGLDCRDLNPDGECVSFDSITLATHLMRFFKWLVQ